MYIRLRIFFILITAVIFNTAQASEALKYVGLYLCDADTFNETMVKACSQSHPSLSARATDALSAWNSRNRTAVISYAQKCDAELEKKNRSSEERKSIQNRLEEEKIKMLLNIKKEASSDDSAYCEEAISQLVNEKNDLERFYGK